jgi:hypothetical protein
MDSGNGRVLDELTRMNSTDGKLDTVTKLDIQGPDFAQSIYKPLSCMVPISLGWSNILFEIIAQCLMKARITRL